MSSPNDQRFFLELNENYLVAARVSVKSSPLVLEEVGEAKLDSSDAVSAALNTVFGPRDAAKATVCCLLRPASRALHLASADQARQHKTKDAIATFAGTLLAGEAGPVEVAAVQARSGQPLDGSSDQRWLLSGASRTSINGLLDKLAEYKLTAVRVESASIALVDAAQLALNAAKAAKPILLWEFAESASHLVLVGTGGVFGVRRLGFGFDKIVEAVMAELNLKFKGSAAKLFFNDLYDFSETGPKIAARLGADLQPEVAALATEAGVSADTFFCSGLPSTQGWLSKGLADALKLTAWEKQALDWCSAGGIGGVDKIIPSMAPVCAPLLATVSARHVRGASGPVIWHPAWPGGSEPEVVAPAPKAAAPAAAAPAPAKKDAPVSASPKSAPAAPAKAAPAKSEPKPAAKAAPVAAAKVEAKPATAAKPAVAAAASAASAPAKKGPSMGLIISVIAAVVIAGGGFLYIQSEKKAQEERDRAAEEERVALQQRIDEQVAARKKAEEEARLKNEALEAQAAATAAAEQKAEEEARLHEQETNRLLNARGGVKIVTEPAGATVEIGNLASQVSPATFQQMRLGKYTAKVSLAGYDSRTVDFEIQENKVIDPGVIKLARQVGVVDVAVKPAGVRYSIRPAGIRFSVSEDETFEGVSPATIKAVPVGSYVVKLSREGWPDYSEEFQVAKNGTVTLDKDLSGSMVQIRSNPAGASVLLNGSPVGATPLTLNDVVPGAVSYTLELEDHYPVNVSGQLEMNKVLALSADLEAVPFIVDQNQLDSRPVPSRMAQVNLDGITVPDSIVVRVSLTVDFRGYSRDCRLEQEVDAQLGERILEAMAQWRFRPAMLNGRAVSTRTTIPVSIAKKR